MPKIVVKSYYIIRIGKRFVVDNLNDKKLRLSFSEKEAKRFEYFGLKEMEVALRDAMISINDLSKSGQKNITIIGRDVEVDRADIHDENVLMWDRLLDRETALNIINLSIENNGENEASEDFIAIHKFLSHVRAINYKEVVVLAVNWKSLSAEKQANLAISYASQLHASRFMMLMDYLSLRFLEGKL